MTWNELIKWLPLFVAIIAGLFALRQIRLNNITNARIKWLETLRQTIADFISEVTSLSLVIGIDKGIEELKRNGEFAGNPEDGFIFPKELSKQLQCVQLKYDLIRLNLNPKEDLHKKLENLLDQYIGMVNQLPATDNNRIDSFIKEMRTCSEKLVSAVRVILKLEWEKTKRSRLSFCYFMRFGKGKELREEILQEGVLLANNRFSKIKNLLIIFIGTILFQVIVFYFVRNYGR